MTKQINRMVEEDSSPQIMGNLETKVIEQLNSKPKLGENSTEKKSDKFKAKGETHLTQNSSSSKTLGNQNEKSSNSINKTKPANQKKEKLVSNSSNDQILNEHPDETEEITKINYVRSTTKLKNIRRKKYPITLMT